MSNQKETHCLPSLPAPQNDSMCKVVFDTYLCWPSAAPGSIATLPCPALRGLDITKKAVRNCSSVGLWTNMEGKPDNESIGWTNYAPCVIPELREIFDSAHEDNSDFQLKLAIAEATRVLELVGYATSMTCLIISIFIMFCFKSLNSPKTRIHKHLFTAMALNVCIRLVIYVDQIIVRRGHAEFGIDNITPVCLAFYIMLEYSKTVVFMWFLVEGIYLNYVLSVTFSRYEPNFCLYHLVGWGSPIAITVTWIVVNNYQITNNPCWSFYNMYSTYWILEGPRLTALLVNTTILIITLKTVHVKLKMMTTSKVKQILKSAKAAIVLMPLLGLCNALHMIRGPLEKDVAVFALWAFSSYFFASFQGFFITLTYCFLNKRVHIALKSKWNVFWMNQDMDKESSRGLRRRSTKEMSLSRQGTTEATSLALSDMEQSKANLDFGGDLCRAGSSVQI